MLQIDIKSFRAVNIQDLMLGENQDFSYILVDILAKKDE